MAGVAPSLVAPPGRGRPVTRAVGEPAWVRALLIGVALTFLSLLLLLPVGVVLIEAFRDGIGPYLNALVEPDTLSAIRLTVTTTLIAVAVNLVFGIAAAWAIARFEFRGRDLLITLIDLPFAVSPVISGMVFVLLFGAQGLLGPFLQERDVRIVFAEPGLILATTFVTFPFVARELIPFMRAQGSEEEQAALVLGASGWQMFWRVTLPNARWALLHALVLCSARAMGEFGAVSVVSGHIRGETNTVPLHVETLYGEYRFSSAFAVASLLLVVALFALVAKRLTGRFVHAQTTSAQGAPPGH